MNKKIIVSCEMEERWIDHFCSFLKRLQYNGEQGRSRLEGFYSDGDGDFRPKFSFLTLEEAIVKDCEPIENINEIRPKDYFDAG